MCYVQNKANVLQSEQGHLNQYGTMVFSVCQSLYFGLFRFYWRGVYWSCSNILSVVQLILLNIWINPKNYIDYDTLEEGKEELRKAKEFMSAQQKADKSNPYRTKGKEDYKRFLKTQDKKIVFYSEKAAFTSIIKIL